MAFRKLQAIGVALAALSSGGTLVGAKAQSFPPESPPCPTSKLAPYGGLAPIPNQCNTPNCLVRAYTDKVTNNQPYQWWTSYQYYGSGGGYFYNGGLQTTFAPKHVTTDASGRLHLVANNDINLGGGFVWSGAEAVLMFNGDGTEANLGYGDYLVAVRLNGGPLNSLDPNMAIGLFLYERYGTDKGAAAAQTAQIRERTAINLTTRFFVSAPRNLRFSQSARRLRHNWRTGWLTVTVSAPITRQRWS